jgi:hypothetical protein
MFKLLCTVVLAVNTCDAAITCQLLPMAYMLTDVAHTALTLCLCLMITGSGKSYTANMLVKKVLEYVLAVKDNTLPYEDSATTVQSVRLTHKNYTSEFKRTASQYEDVLLTDCDMAIATWEAIRASQLSAETAINTESSRAPLLLDIDIVVSCDR